MPNVLIRDLPDEVHARLQQRAERAGQSLQQYLTSQLAKVADEPTIDEVLAGLSEHRGGVIGFGAAVDDLTAERART